MKPMMDVGKACLAALAVVAATLWAACGGDEPITYLHREDSVLVQKVTTSFPPEAALPDLTLYGDGTLIYLEAPADQASRLLRAQLPDDAVLELLELFIDEGFLDFVYEQPAPERATSQPTTFLYIRTMRDANAVSAVAIDSVLPDDAGDEFDEFRKLQRIVQELDEIDPIALGGSAPVEYDPEGVLLVVEPRSPPNVAGSPARWPYEAITLEEIAPEDELVEVMLEGEDAAAFNGWVPPTGWFEGERYYDVGWRPLLPYEENFPQFFLP